MSKFEIREDSFYLDGEKFQIVSGSIHYFRVVPEYWRDRLEKLKNMGCNTVETYIPWNWHEAEKGKWDFSGWRDFEKFLDISKELGLYAIVRPSPYVCAEWEFGGLPAWLLAEPGMRLRCSYKPFLDYVKRYYDQLLPKLVNHQITKDGNIILFQIENEYGYYSDDKDYLKFLSDTMKAAGLEVPFITSDGPWGKCFEVGQTEGALPTGNFGSNAEWQFGEMQKMMPKKGPLMCTEFWTGWFDAWGNPEHKTSNIEENVKDLEYFLQHGHVNFYMWHGGTSFGFMNGANYGETGLTPDVTSYDYDAALSEDGQITAKYEAFKQTIAKYRKWEEVPLSTQIKRKAYGKLTCQGKASLFANIDKVCQKKIRSVQMLSQEEAGQNWGYTLYSTKIPFEYPIAEITLGGASDRAIAYGDGKKLFTAFDRELSNSQKFEPTGLAPKLDILTENMGRVNFSQVLEDQKKGVSKHILINGIRHCGWDIYTLPLEKAQIDKLEFTEKFDEDSSDQTPAFFKFTFEVDEACDTFVDTEGWGKGNVFLNGFNLGRFWEVGPQKRLYLPAPLLKKGQNEIIIFETEGKRCNTIELASEPKLG